MIKLSKAVTTIVNPNIFTKIHCSSEFVEQQYLVNRFESAIVSMTLPTLMISTMQCRAMRSSGEKGASERGRRTGKKKQGKGGPREEETGGSRRRGDAPPSPIRPTFFGDPDRSRPPGAEPRTGEAVPSRRSGEDTSREDRPSSIRRTFFGDPDRYGRPSRPGRATPGRAVVRRPTAAV